MILSLQKGQGQSKQLKRKALGFAGGFTRLSCREADYKPSSVLERYAPVTAIHLDLQLPAGSSDQPGSYPSPVITSLFSLAPSEVYRAPHVTIRAVRSYRTFSPFPFQEVSFLLHFLSGRPALPLAGTLTREVLGLSSPTCVAVTVRPPRDTLSIPPRHH
jgi:hypothetical protein